MASKRFQMDQRKIQCAKLIFEGQITKKEIAKKLFPVYDENGEVIEGKLRNAQNKISMWCGEPVFQEYIRRLVRQEAIPRYSKAMSLLDKQLSDGNAWVAQGAARELINQVSTMVLGEEKQEVVVRVEGAPAMGEPDDDDEAEDE